MQLGKDLIMDYTPIILGICGVLCAIAYILAPMFGAQKDDEYYSALADFEEEWQAKQAAERHSREKAPKQRELF